MDEELGYQSLDDAVNAFMGEDYSEATDTPEDDEDEVVEEEEVEEVDESDDDAEDEGEEDEAGGEEDEAEGDDTAEEPTYADDAHTVKVTVNGEEQSFTVGDLKRLAGQESALTQRSQALAEQRRTIENQGIYLSKVLQDRYTTAKAEADKYAKVDLFKASRELDDDDFDALRTAKEAADSNLAALTQEAQSFVQNANKTRSDLLREQAKEARRVLQRDIPEWSDELYSDLRSYAVKMGMDTTMVNELVDPAAFKIIHRAMLADRTTEKAKTVQKRVAKTPKKVVRKSATTTDNSDSKLKAARRKAAQSGSVDDVTELFIASLQD